MRNSGVGRDEGEPSLAVPVGLGGAWEIRKRSFPDLVHFSAPSVVKYDTEWYSNRPSGFVPVSVTGGECGLRCDHCNAKILRNMIPATTPADLVSLADKLASTGCRGLLLSGGANRQGSVPLGGFARAISSIKQKHGFLVAAHTGLVDDALAVQLAEAQLDMAMIDVIGSETTMRNVYHLDASLDDCIASVQRLRARGIPVAPHVVLGLDYGRLRGEAHALHALSGCDIQALVLVVIMPLGGTPMAGVKPPDPSELAPVFDLARRLFPTTHLFLGCARPAGEYKRHVEILALKAGFNGVAFPSRQAIDLARDLNLRIVFSDVCCALSTLADTTKGQ